MTPSPWVVRWSPLVAPGARVLDVACGRGRHLRWFASRDAVVTGVDRDADALAASSGLGRLINADIEANAWPLSDEAFDAVIVTNYLWRPLFSTLLASVADGGILLYETFGCEQPTHGRPTNPQFLLQPLELIRAFGDLHIVAYEDVVLDGPKRHVQRLAAQRRHPAPAASTAKPPPRPR